MRLLIWNPSSPARAFNPVAVYTTQPDQQAEIDALKAKLAEYSGSVDLADAVSFSMRKAYQLGQTYWQQADSEYFSQNKKCDDTQAKFDALVDEIRALFLQGKNDAE